jgi:Polyketide cyclase / dehydrase and lipid transport
MPTLHFAANIEGPCKTVFGLIADITQYDHWLLRSSAFGAVTQVSPTPVGLGTTYIDQGQSGTMKGSITEYQPPTHITFQQSMPVKLLVISGTLELHIRYSLESAGHVTRVNRDVTFHLPGMLKVAQPIIVSTVRRESKRLLQIMKRTIEEQT